MHVKRMFSIPMAVIIARQPNQSSWYLELSLVSLRIDLQDKSVSFLSG